MPDANLPSPATIPGPDHGGLVAGLAAPLDQSRRRAARAVNGVLTATYWEIGRRIVEFEQGGAARAEYGSELLERPAAHMTPKFGRGYGRRNLFYMKSLYLGWQISQAPSGAVEASAIFQDPVQANDSGIVQTPSALFPSEIDDGDLPDLSALLGAFPPSWSQYTRLMAVAKPHARAFSESEAIRGGWSVRQLARQVGTQFFERTSASTRRDARRRPEGPARGCGLGAGRGPRPVPARIST